MASTASVNWMLPPIGTSKYPFIGNFDGKGYTISNLVVDNAIGDGHITRKPSTVGSSISDVNIVGTFGVVGDYGTTLSGYTYSSSANSVANFTIKDSDIRSSASQTLIGIAAGYVNSTMSNVSIKSSKATVASGSNALSNGPTTNISDYTTIGYCAPSFRKNYNQSVTTIKAPSLTTSEFAYEGSGDEEGWGGSIDMKTMVIGADDRVIAVAHPARIDAILIAAAALAHPNRVLFDLEGHWGHHPLNHNLTRAVAFQ